MEANKTVSNTSFSRRTKTKKAAKIEMEDILAKFGLKGIHVLTGIIGSVVALVFGKPRKGSRAKVRAFFTVISGAAVTGYLTPLIFLWKPKLESAEHTIAFVVGLFGMGIIEGLFNLIGKFKTNPIGTIKEIKGCKDENIEGK